MEPNPIQHMYPTTIVGTTITAYMTKTQLWSYQIGANSPGADVWLWETFFDETRVTRKTCEEQDCFHRCYGTAETAWCGKCYDYINYYASYSQLGNPDVQQELIGLCNKCEVPPTADPEIPAEHPAYVPLAFKDPMTFVEYEEEFLEYVEEQREL